MTAEFSKLVRSAVERYGMRAVSQAVQASPQIVQRWSEGQGSPSLDGRRAIYHLCIERLDFDLMELAFPAIDLGHVRLPHVPTRIGPHVLDFPFGIAASYLTSTSRGIAYFANQGFDLLTYKTVRSKSSDPFPSPNRAFTLASASVKVEPPFKQTVIADPGYFPIHAEDVGMVNSVGVPSFHPDIWQPDIKRAKDALHPGQLLVVSIMGTAEPGDGDGTAFIEDFVSVASMAKSAGADIIEANYSCPNLLQEYAGDVYHDPVFSSKISSAIRQVIGSTPLLVKIGYLAEAELKAFVQHNRSHIDGIVAINTVRMRVELPTGGPVFPGREFAGLSGPPIRTCAREIIANLATIRNENPGDRFSIVATGGADAPEDVFAYLELGADVVQCCTAAYSDPLLAARVREHALLVAQR